MRPSLAICILIVMSVMQCRKKESPGTLPNENSRQKMVGLYLFVPSIDTTRFFSDCQEWGVNRIFSNDQYWDSSFLSKAESFDIDVGLLFPVFFNQRYLETHAEDYCITSRGNKAIKDWLHFACPTSEPFKRYQKEYFRKALHQLKPEMVVLDFIRFYVHWERVGAGASPLEMEDGCYCDRCLSAFETFSGVLVEHRTPEWIKQNALSDWATWKCHVIEHTTKEFADIVNEYDPSARIGVKTVPWSNEEHHGAIRSVAGQDLTALKDHVDFFMPMTYSHLLDNEPEWITAMLKDVNRITGKEVYATVQMEKVFSEQNDISNTEFKILLETGLEDPSQGIVLFHYQSTPGNKQKGKLIRTYF